jgi:hypothetical protein
LRLSESHSGMGLTMAEPASGTVAASTAVATATGGIFAIGTFIPPGASLMEFAWGCFFSMCGAFAFQFIAAQVERQNAADAKVPIAERPTIDWRTVGYSILGAPLSAAALIFGIHYFHGSSGFGDATFFQSIAGFMAAGATGPKIVIKGVAYIVFLASSRMEGKPR